MEIFFKCDFSEEEFIEESNLSNHLNNHLDKKPFVCHVCKEVFAEENDYNIHYDGHSEEEKKYVMFVMKNLIVKIFCSNTF